MFHTTEGKQAAMRDKMWAQHKEREAAWRLHIAQVRRQIAAEPPSIVNALVLAAS